MAKLWLNIIKPKGAFARWLVFLSLVTLAVLSTLGHFALARRYLDTEALTLSVGNYSISAFSFLTALVTLVMVFWISAAVSDLAEYRIAKIQSLQPATRTLVLKFVQIAIYVVAFLLSLNIFGIDLTTLTVFSGALGIGLGFGLQKIASNFISGIILLFEKAIEPDDLVELADGTFGFVRKASARYTLIEGYDGKEILVPNEDFISSRVINWSFSNSRARVEISLRVSYGSDIEKAYEIALQAASAHARCLQDPAPTCYLRSFSENSIDFILHFWIADVIEGRWEPQSDVMFEIWRRFKLQGIEIPFPQRDLHLVNPDAIKVVQDRK